MNAQVIVTIDTSSAGRQQVIGGFGTCLAYTEAEQHWWQQFHYDDLQASILRVDLTPAFATPYSDYLYNSRFSVRGSRPQRMPLRPWGLSSNACPKIRIVNFLHLC
ncbi:MAG: hypothetical protein ACYDH9_24550 [Limisphaerales bacterium]